MNDLRRSPDTLRFLQTLERHRTFFAASPVTIARAPGRLDVMGGIADYSGSLVLQLPLAVAAFAAVQWTDDPQPTATVRAVGAREALPDVTVAIADLVDDYAAVRARFAADPSRHWAAYVLGAITVLHRERLVPFDRSVRMLLASDVPIGKGVSSSAAIEVAAMQGLRGILDTDAVIDGRDLALLCQKVENIVVGAPCGVMDQMTAACGIAEALLALLCQPAELQDPVRLPDEIELFGIDSGIRHAVSGADYGSVRVGAFMGYRIVAALAGLDVTDASGRISVVDPRWHGYLANVTPEEWNQEFRDRVPEHLTGRDFLAAYGGSTDRVTTIDPGRRYAVRQPAAHPIREHARVQRFRTLLTSRPVDDDVLAELGALMYESHASYSACGLGSSGTDAIVDLVRAAGPAQGLFGAKITGGGSGGTVAVLARRGRREVVEMLAARYARDTGLEVALLSGSSSGAARFGTMTVTSP